MKTLVLSLSLVFATSLALPAWAQDAKNSKPASLGELLQRVKTGYRANTEELKKREAEFKADKNNQAKLLKQARATLAAEQKRSDKLEREFDTNEALMARMEETLRIRLGTMGELFGVIRQVAGDARSHVDSSLVAAQFPGRGDELEPLTKSKSLPSIKELEHLWYLLQQEMIESGKVVQFPATVVTVDGVQKEMQVVRVGVFNAVANGRYLNWMPEVSKLQELVRQPAERYLSTVADLENAKEGYVRMAIDPSRGSLLALLIQTPSFIERLEFGGIIGYIIIGLGLTTLFLALLRLAMLAFVGFKVRRQRHKKEAKASNPLGRILGIYEKNRGLDTETLEAKIDEAILHESAKLNRFLWAVKIVSVVAPLLGLLGTVTGMIQTFQSITLFGTGDPKLMAGGISEALVTTMLGLMVAIPLVLLHSWMKSMTVSVTEILEQQSAGIIAKRREELCSADTAD